MTGLIIIGVIIFLYWILFSDRNRSTISRGPSSNNTTTTIHFPQPTKPVVSKPTVKTPETITVSPKTISVAPKTINSNPDSRLSLIGGEYRTFQNYYIGGVQYTFGFPNENCRDKRVWVGIGKEEVERISQDEAMRRIQNKTIGINAPPKQIDSWTYDSETDDLPF